MHHIMRMHWEVEVKLHTFLTCALDGGECAALHLSHCTTGDRTLITHPTVVGVTVVSAWAQW
jgi:hypothetical protein